ncbi:MAG: histidine phosphatase family protein [Chloroflexi bacterium]|nr:histidine phosphatase family protein [Chloroflexota bacterium]
MLDPVPAMDATERSQVWAEVLLIVEPHLRRGETLMLTVRHGLTELNRDQRVGGQIDVPLLPEGREQAEVARQAFDGTVFDVVISSPMERAVETAAIVTGVPSSEIEIEPLCTERSFGQMEGLTRAEVEQRFTQIVYLHIGHIAYSLNPPGGESFEDLRRRAQRFLEGLMSKHPGERIVVTSHQNFLQQFHGLLLGRDPYDALRTDLLNLELNQFHLGSDRAVRAHRKFQLFPDAQKHASF